MTPYPLRPTGGMAGGVREAIRAEIQRRGINQAQLARMLGVTEKHVSHSLTGRTGMNIEMLDRVAEVLGCDWALVSSQYEEEP